MVDMIEPTPQNVRKLLKAKGWTQVHAAGLLEMSPETFCRYCMVDGKSKLTMPRPAWHLLLLRAGMHPKYALVPRDLMSGERLE